jgi:hypothetical protein
MYPRLENGKIPEKKIVTTDNHDHPHTVTGVVVEENEKGILNPLLVPIYTGPTFQPKIQGQTKMVFLNWTIKKGSTNWL